MKLARVLAFLALLILAQVAAVLADPVKSLRVVLPDQHGTGVERIVQIFARQVSQRCDARVTTTDAAPLTVALAIQPGIGAEGYTIADGPAGTIRILGNDQLGLLYGVGKFLRFSRYDRGGFSAGSWRGTSVPVCPLRGIYLATHFNNFYEAAPLADVGRYVEDVSLWGFNTVLVCVEPDVFTGFDDPAAGKVFDRVRGLLRTAKSAGLRVGFLTSWNQGFRTVPKEIRAVDFTSWHPDGGFFGVNVCPSNPAGRKYLIKQAGWFLDQFADVGLDYVEHWPYDEGGCGCEKCRPWGGRGYVDLSKEISAMARAKYPGCKIIVSAWCFDCPTKHSDNWEEWEGLSKAVAADQSWVDYIMTDNYFGDFPGYPLKKGVPGGLPLLDFPEISMYGQRPWGGYGANPLPARIQGRWNVAGAKLAGGAPYSEGIYEDLDKVICAQLYWRPDRPTVETVKEYAAFEGSPDVVGNVLEAVQILEENHLRPNGLAWPSPARAIGGNAVRAFDLLERADARLTPQARHAWRWRILYLRGLIDREMYKNSLGQASDAVFERARQELEKIYYAQNVMRELQPARLRAVDLDGPSLPAEYAKAVAASKPRAWWRMSLAGDPYVDESAAQKNGAGLMDASALIRRVADATGHNHPATCQQGVMVGMPVAAAQTPAGRAASFENGRLKATVANLTGNYSVELWFQNRLAYTARPITGYIFSRGQEGSPGNPPPCDTLGIQGTYKSHLAGRLFVYCRDSRNVDRDATGTTLVAPGSWNHVVFVRNGCQIRVYLNGAATPEISCAMDQGYSDAVPLFIGGRNDNFANFQGKIADVSLYDRALSAEEAAGHDRTAGRRDASPRKE
jgi:hypothetical protein